MKKISILSFVFLLSSICTSSVFGQPIWEKILKGAEEVVNELSLDNPKTTVKSKQPSSSTNNSKRSVPRPSPYESSVLNGQNIKVSNSLKDYDVKILSCEGNSNSQVVTLTFLVQHQLVNQTLTYNYRNSSVYTDEGDQITNLKVYIGSKKTANIIHTDAPLKCKVYIHNMLARFGNLNKVAIGLKSRNYDGGKNFQSGALEIRDIPVQWN